MDENGVLLPDQAEKITEIGNLLKNSMFEGDYGKATKAFLSEFPVQASLTQSYFEAFGGFTNNEIYEQVYQSSVKAAADLLSGNSIDKALIDPVKQFLTQNTNAGASFTDVVKGLREIIEGTPEIDGKLLRHVKLYARDSFAVTDRSYTQIISREMGFVYYRYVGGLIKDTREFCKVRAGNIYHKKEIQKWAGQSWQGKNSATNEATIFQLCGGYNCIHSLIPVGITEVPPFVLRATEGL